MVVVRSFVVESVCVGLVVRATEFEPSSFVVKSVCVSAGAVRVMYTTKLGLESPSASLTYNVGSNEGVKPKPRTKL